MFNINLTAAAAAKLLKSCPTLWDPIDGSPPGFSIHWILQARTLEWVAISFSNAWKWKVKVKSLSHVQLLATPWTTAYQAPPSMGFSRQEYWSGLPEVQHNMYIALISSCKSTCSSINCIYCQKIKLFICMQKWSFLLLYLFIQEMSSVGNYCIKTLVVITSTP